MDKTALIISSLLFCIVESNLFSNFKLSLDITDVTCQLSDIHKSSTQSGRLRCASECTLGDSCQSFFYATEAQTCVECKTIYNSTLQAGNAATTSSYYTKETMVTRSWTTVVTTLETTSSTTSATTSVITTGTTSKTTTSTSETTTGTTTTTTTTMAGSPPAPIGGSPPAPIGGTSPTTVTGTTTASQNYVGCYNFVAGEEADNITANKQSVCDEFCASHFYDTYSTQGTRCDCHGPMTVISLVQQSEDKCKHPCPGDNTEFCGDPSQSTMSVYTSSFTL